MKKAKTQKVVAPKEDDLKYIFYFYRPQLIESLWKWDLEEGDNAAEVRKPVQKIYAAGHYCYAISGNDVYSWGIGENYVLGNRQDENEFTPYKLNPKMFEFNKVEMMACGTQHCVALTLDSPESKVPDLNTAAFKIGAPVLPPSPKPEQPAAESEPKLLLSQQIHHSQHQNSQHINGQNGSAPEQVE